MSYGCEGTHWRKTLGSPFRGPLHNIYFGDTRSDQLRNLKLNNWILDSWLFGNLDEMAHALYSSEIRDLIFPDDLVRVSCLRHLCISM
jgi:hypothetical protein